MPNSMSGQDLVAQLQPSRTAARPNTHGLLLRESRQLLSFLSHDHVRTWPSFFPASLYGLDSVAIRSTDCNGLVIAQVTRLAPAWLFPAPASPRCQLPCLAPTAPDQSSHSRLAPVSPAWISPFMLCLPSAPDLSLSITFISPFGLTPLAHTPRHHLYPGLLQTAIIYTQLLVGAGPPACFNSPSPQPCF